VIGARTRTWLAESLRALQVERLPADVARIVYGVLPDRHRGRECDGDDRSAARYEAPNRAAAFFTSFGATQKIAP
jgi:hypothetical protein